MSALGKRSVSAIPFPSVNPRSSVAQAVQAFVLDRRIAGATSATISTYHDQLNPFVAWCEQTSIDLPQIDVDQVRSYLAVRQRISSSALFEAARRLKTFFRWCQQEHMCEDAAARIRLPKQEQKIIPALAIPQVRALLAVCSKDSFVGRRDEALFRVLLDSGLRISEALGLTVPDVNVAAGRALVRCGKGQKQRMVPFGPRTQRALAKYLSKREACSGASDVLFVGSNGSPLNRRHVEQHLSRLAHRAGIVDVRVTPHVLRHTCALWFLRRGGDAFSLQMLLGHSTLEMTKRYVAMTTNDVGAAHAKFGAGDLV